MATGSSPAESKSFPSIGKINTNNVQVEPEIRQTRRFITGKFLPQRTKEYINTRALNTMMKT